ncbi:hypothetical protein PQR62_12220 [Herbaspirillum lusitanum]|uniref:Uncharacterized protein n=1 Tax=Herbaspirillum lusitanum TaxID=213312 RepID=A0ABW9A9X6_9BURK
MNDTSSPSIEEFQQLQKTVNSLVDNNAATAASDLALLISIIGHLSTSTANPSHSIQSIGMQAADFLAPVLQSEKFPAEFKALMKSRIDAIIGKALETYATQEKSVDR